MPGAGARGCRTVVLPAVHGEVTLCAPGVPHHLGYGGTEGQTCVNNSRWGSLLPGPAQPAAGGPMECWA